MRKTSFIRIKSLFLAASARFYTHTRRAAMPKHRLEPRIRSHDPINADARDMWLFSPDDAFDAATTALTHEMNGLAQSLQGLRETLSVINGLTPIVEAAAIAAPNALQHHDSLLFEGEAAAAYAPQDTVLSDATDFLFQDISVDETRIQQAA